MKKRWRRSLAAVALAAILAGTAGMQQAEAAVDTEAACRLTVQASGEAFAEDVKEADVVVDLYRVADAVKIPGADSYGYQPAEAYEGIFEGILDGDGVPDLEAYGSGWQGIARQAAAVVLAGGSGQTPVVTGAPAWEPIEQLDSGEPLGCGLYLLVARGKDLEDYVKEIPGDGGEEARYATVALSGEYEYTFFPELVTLPTKDAVEMEDGSSYVGTDNPGEWLYDLTGGRSVTLKPEQEPRYGSLRIVKRLLEYETKEPATFVFSIEAVKDGEVVYSDVVSMTFDGAGEEERVVEKLPVGSVVTVTEVYSGSSYELTAGDPESKEVTVEAEQVAQATYTNTYNTTSRGGHGIENHFAYTEHPAEGEDGPWSWTQPEE